MKIIITDTGPLWSFAIVNQLDLLGERLRGRVRWTSAVADEISRNTASEPKLREVLRQPWLPSPVDLANIDLTLVLEANRIRQTLASAGDHPRAHLGEAESIAYAKTLEDVVLLAEDQGAVNRAKFERLHVKRTTDILSEMVSMGEATENEAWAIYSQLVGYGRLPGGFTREQLFR